VRGRNVHELIRKGHHTQKLRSKSNSDHSNVGWSGRI